ncbi:MULTISPECIES: EAL domain-containing protein [unclassified Xanthobacter]|uniref:EAL domain-containing response regulator n=1 Tax=unclassified Xanthobacter TaxID=2623496 RepID=UPI001F35A67A|nr:MULTISPECIES: EAL domain-containing response regulator [unclassified Xanthobacter]
MKKRVLILDDDEAFREDLGELLDMAGHDVEAIGSVASLTPERLGRCDVLLLDLSLPGLDGTEALRRLSRFPRQPGIVLISGSCEDIICAVADAARLRGTPILGTFKKPFAPEDLLRLINAVPDQAGRSPRRALEASQADIAEALSCAITRGDLPVMFQPKVDARTLAFHGAELLLGDHLPGIGHLPVLEVVAAAASVPGLMKRLSHYTLDAGARGCARWRALGCEGPVSVNLPMDVLLAADAARELAAVVRAAGLAPAQVICELTEDALYDSSSECLMALAQLRLACFGLALDDVGQRQSGLLQLARLPVTELKIDMDLLHRARSSAKAGEIFASLVGLGRRLGMSVVAEGVETMEDLARVRANKVDLIQGYLVARKMPIDDLMAWLMSNRQDLNVQDNLVGGDAHECTDATKSFHIAGG